MCVPARVRVDVLGVNVGVGVGGKCLRERVSTHSRPRACASPAYRRCVSAKCASVREPMSGRASACTGASVRGSEQAGASASVRSNERACE
eukprot:5065681-Pleurochrysis_carterae.AAC.1